MPLYDLRTWVDGQGAPKAGVYAITDPTTLAAFSALLTPYLSTELPLQSVMGQDNPAAPQVTKLLHFADWTTARNIEAQVNGPQAQAAPGLPAEIPLYKIKVLMALTASTHGGTLETRVPTFIATLPEPSKTIADRLWNGPTPNLVVGGDFALGFKAWEGLSDDAWGQLLTTAQHLAL